MSYFPNPAAVRVGQQIRWRNVNGTLHTATRTGGGFDTGPLSPGATSAPITLAAPGSVAYHCGFHFGMVGTLSVTP